MVVPLFLLLGVLHTRYSGVINAIRKRLRGKKVMRYEDVKKKPEVVGFIESLNQVFEAREEEKWEVVQAIGRRLYEMQADSWIVLIPQILSSKTS
jgi:hypothetical protein